MTDDSPARVIRRALLGMEAEGFKGWCEFGPLWDEALNRLHVEEVDRLWLALLEKHRGAWAEAFAGDDFWEVSAVMVAALERLAAREYIRSYTI